MDKKSTIDKSLFSWAFNKSNAKLQFLLLLIIVITVFARVFPLEMQKKIINEAIALRKLDLLFIYCGGYIAAVILASGLKLLINYIQTLIGQRVLAEMRKDLYRYILALPLSYFRKNQPGMVITALVTELAACGNFAGMAFAVPVTSILTLLAFGGYLLWLNWILAVISLSIYPIVLFLVPKLQKHSNRANKDRVDTTRQLSSLIGETISGIHEIHGNGSFSIENQKYGAIVERLLKIRIIWTLYKAGIKTLNNFFNNLSPFLIFLVGGYLSMQGQLELGTLVAFLSAQEKLYDPWKEMIDFYQSYQDASVRYTRTMEYFNVLPEHEILPQGRLPYNLEGKLDIKNLSFTTDTGITLLKNVNLELKQGEHLAVVGFSGSGKSTLAQCIGQQYKYSGGNVLLDGKEVSDLSNKDIVMNTGFVAQSPFIFDGTIEDNLLYSYVAAYDKDSARPPELPSLDDMIEILQQTGIFIDVLRFGLNATIDAGQNPEFTEKIIRVRKNFQIEFGETLADWVEFFDEEKYLYHSCIAENLTFGTANRESFENKNLSKNTYFINFLKEADIYRPLLKLGEEITTQAVDILGTLPPDELFFEQSPIAAKELENFKLLSSRLKKNKLHQLDEADKEMLIGLSLRFVPGKHKMAGLPRMLKSLILEARAMFRDKIISEDPGAFTFANISEYISSETILNNIFFGKTKTDNTKVQERISRNINMLLIEEDILEEVIKIGMQFEVGSKGDKLSGGQRQKLAIARVFLKDPGLIIMDEATSALDNKSQGRIQNLLERKFKGRTTLIAVIHRLDIIKNYDRVAVLKAGKIVELGTYDELIAKKEMLYELQFGKQ